MPAGVLRIVPSLDGDLAGDAVCAVRDEQEVAGRERRSEKHEDREERRAREGEPRGGESTHSHSSARVSPPSTGITVPVTYDGAVGGEEGDDRGDLGGRAEAPGGICSSAVGRGAIVAVEARGGVRCRSGRARSC